VAAIRALLDDPEQRRRLGEAARRLVESRFTVAHMSQHFRTIYHALSDKA